MSNRRPLDTNLLAEEFVHEVLGYIDCSAEEITRLVDVEIQMPKLEARPTSTHRDYRSSKYRTIPARKKLNQQILAELIDKPRLGDDNELCLGKGGAKPKVTKQERRAYIVSGGPASGKSTIATRLADRYGAYILDSDYAIRKFPEFYEHAAGASLVHDEADALVFDMSGGLFTYCIQRGYNVAVPLIGRTYESVAEILEILLRNDYEIHLISIALDRTTATLRAYERFRKTGRYVPLSYVFDDVGNEPERIYYRIKRDFAKQLKSYALITTDVDEGEQPIIIETAGRSPVRTLWEKAQGG